jgi:hypothetical protein
MPDRDPPHARGTLAQERLREDHDQDRREKRDRRRFRSGR